MEAYRALANLLEQAERTRSLFQQAGVSVPDTLQRLLRGDSTASGSNAGSIFRPPAPPEAEPDWVWISIADTTATTLSLAIVRGTREPLTTREIRERIVALGSTHERVLVGTVANAGTRAAQHGDISRDEEGRWILLKKEAAAIIHEGNVWGPPRVFQMQELAAHRRDAIVHLLRQNPVGLQQMQISAMLKQGDQLSSEIPSNKDLIKADMEAMNGARVRRVGNSKKWEAI
jgi:hypothetical protein